jgi:hypothetical protein
MINFNFSLNNPFSTRFDIVKSSSAQVTNNKSIEVSLYESNVIFGLELYINTMRDHAGVTCRIGFAGFCAEMVFYDNRHWDSNTGRFLKEQE